MKSGSKKNKKNTINQAAAIKRVIAMMAIPGSSTQEREIAEWIRDQLLKAGAKKSQICFDSANKKSPAGGNCGNLIFKMPGTLKAPRRLFSAHLDTVPLCVGCKPVRRGGRIVSARPSTALGADDRAGCAVLLSIALEILQRDIQHPPLTFMWTVQEETGMHGVRGATLSKLGNPKLAYNWDGGTPNDIVVGATGCYGIKIVISGLASHAGGHPEAGVSCAAVFALAVAELHEGGWHGLINKGGVRATSNIGTVSGISPTNVVLDRLELRAEVRAHKSSLRRRVMEAYLKAFTRAARKVRNSSGKCATITFEAIRKYDPFCLKESDPLVQTVFAAMKSLRLSPQLQVSNGGLDANWLYERGIPAVTLGCGMTKVHTIGEQLIIKNFIKGCRLGLTLALG
jgi:tripeptide aminopeptidase